MDIIMLKPSSKTSVAFSPSKYLEDDHATLPPDVTTITQPGKNRIGMLGHGGVISISLAGMASCKGTECKVVPSFLPSKHAVNDINDARDIINVYLSSDEGFIGELALDARKAKRLEKKIVSGVSEIAIKMAKKGNFSIKIGDDVKMVDRFIIDPAVVSSVNIHPDRRSIVASLTGAACEIGIDKMREPNSTVMFCSDDTSRLGAYNLKAYLNIRKEQFIAARSIQLASSPTRMRVSFDHSTRCHVNGEKVCCRNDDDDEICY